MFFLIYPNHYGSVVLLLYKEQKYAEQEICCGECAEQGSERYAYACGYAARYAQER